ncbi:MAG: leucyl/phenylalanyl-tRNA--protein transferase [Pseudohongiellaceae bacterium]
MPIPWLSPDDSIAFPPVELALDDPNGLLAAGGLLTRDWLLAAYRRGIFPWYEQGDPILWWSPDPRLVLIPDQVHLSRSLRKLIRKQPYVLTLDQDFPQVIAACSAPRDGSDGTWITPAMQQAYCDLHDHGHAHSVEVWDGDELVGGLYGVAIGRMFYGESMFSAQTNTSKIAVVYLARQLQQWDFAMIDCQVKTAHLQSMGAKEIPRQEFLRCVQRNVTINGLEGPWQFDSQLNVIDYEL